MLVPAPPQQASAAGGRGAVAWNDWPSRGAWEQRRARYWQKSRPMAVLGQGFPVVKGAESCFRRNGGRRGGSKGGINNGGLAYSPPDLFNSLPTPAPEKGAMGRGQPWPWRHSHGKQGGLGSGLITRRGQWRPGGGQNGRRGRSGRSGLQETARSSDRKRASRFCGACDPASCGHGLVSCGTDGAGCPAGPASCGFCCCHPLDLPSPWPQAANLQHPISASEVTALPLAQVEP